MTADAELIKRARGQWKLSREDSTEIGNRLEALAAALAAHDAVIAEALDYEAPMGRGGYNAMAQIEGMQAVLSRVADELPADLVPESFGDRLDRGKALERRLEHFMAEWRDNPVSWSGWKDSERTGRQLSLLKLVEEITRG